MTAKLDGTNGVTFPDGTTQSTAGITPTSTQLCKAWVNFFGGTSTSIRASYNVSSVIRGGVGSYTVNFTSALSDANYSTVGMCADVSTGNGASLELPYSGTYTTSAVALYAYQRTGGTIDPAIVNIAVFR